MGGQGRGDEQSWGHTHPIHTVTPFAKAGQRALSLAPRLCGACGQVRLREAQLSLDCPLVQSLPLAPFRLQEKVRIPI